jgi:hypothetical protein
MLQTTGFHICKQKTIDNCTWNLSLKFIEVRIFCYLIPVIGKNMISWFYAYVEHIEIKTKTVNIIHFWSNLLSNATVSIIEIVRNCVRGDEANVYGSSYYWNFKTSSFKQVACLILYLLVVSLIHFCSQLQYGGELVRLLKQICSFGS